MAVLGKGENALLKLALINMSREKVPADYSLYAGCLDKGPMDEVWCACQDEVSGA